jgi:hypothetical protein
MDDAKTIFENKGKDDIIEDQKLLVSATLSSSSSI